VAEREVGVGDVRTDEACSTGNSDTH
jgi:hypothetical protein